MSQPQPTQPQPTLFVNHGAGPCFWSDLPAPFGPGAFDGLARYLRGLMATLPQRPAAVLVISGHWEAALPTVGSAAQPGMLFDYYGFPAHTYQLSLPAPGAPALAHQVRQLLAAAGIASAEDAERGFDHGVFVPFLLITPAADVPIVTLSLQRDLDPAQHWAIGRALAPLRQQNVLIVGSGQSYHNLGRFFDGDGRSASAFDDWLSASVSAEPASRRQRLLAWAEAPSARAAHPRAEHLLPLMVVAGAAEDQPGRVAWHERIGGKPFSGYHFG